MKKIILLLLHFIVMFFGAYLVLSIKDSFTFAIITTTLVPILAYVL